MSALTTNAVLLGGTYQYLPLSPIIVPNHKCASQWRCHKTPEQDPVDGHDWTAPQSGICLTPLHEHHLDPSPVLVAPTPVGVSIRNSHVQHHPTVQPIGRGTSLRLLGHLRPIQLKNVRKSASVWDLTYIPVRSSPGPESDAREPRVYPAIVSLRSPSKPPPRTPESGPGDELDGKAPQSGI